MKRLSVLLWAPVILFSACAFALDAPSANEILQKAAETEKKMDVERGKYTYHMHQETHKANKDGSAGSLLHSVDHDFIFLGNRSYWKPLLVNGKPLDHKMTERWKAEAKKAAEQEGKSQSQGDEYHPVRGGINIGSVRDLLRLMDNTVLREELLNSRKAWVIQALPKKDAVRAAAQDDQLLSYRQLLWIDQQDFAVAQREIHVIREHINPQPQHGDRPPLKPGSFARWTFAREANGDWLTQTGFVYNISKYPAGSISFGDDRHVTVGTYSNYKKFDVNTTITFDPDQQ